MRCPFCWFRTPNHGGFYCVFRQEMIIDIKAVFNRTGRRLSLLPNVYRRASISLVLIPLRAAVVAAKLDVENFSGVLALAPIGLRGL